MNFKDYLKILASEDGSDLYLLGNAPPSGKFLGQLKPLNDEPLDKDGPKRMAYEVMSEEQIVQFEQKPEMNLAISEPGIGRFRINIYKQRNQVAMVVRNIKTVIPTVSQMGLPDVLKDIIMAKRGLVLFVGGTGSGKSTSLAALIDHRNQNSHGHIITIEDPIEFVHQNKKSIISQREVGVDTDSFEDALKNTLRQAPDVILIGEIRDKETMEHALAFADTGHLAISTLHANSASQALDRIINFFPESKRHQLLMDLSLNLRAFISQRLIPTPDGKRVAAIEILLGSPRVCELIKKGELDDIKEAMEKDANSGMITFDQALIQLTKSGKISAEEAVRNADSQNDVRLNLSLGDESSDATNDSAFSLVVDKSSEDEQLVSGKSSFNISKE